MVSSRSFKENLASSKEGSRFFSFGLFEAPLALFGYPHEILVHLPVAVFVVQHGDGEHTAGQQWGIAKLQDSRAEAELRWLSPFRVITFG
jgi:hypothetical protein